MGMDIDENHKVLIDTIADNMYQVMIEQRFGDRLNRIESRLDGIFDFHENILVSANEARKILRISPNVIRKYEEEEVLTNVSEMKTKKQFKLSEVFKLYELKKLTKGKGNEI